MSCAETTVTELATCSPGGHGRWAYDQIWPNTRRRHVTANQVSPTHATDWFGSCQRTRPTCSRVTTAEGRFPGSRVSTLHRLPGIRAPQWHVDGGRSQLRGQLRVQVGNHPHRIPFFIPTIEYLVAIRAQDAPP
jgi:hypothetical protein